jgi:hypothetical protein
MTRTLRWAGLLVVLAFVVPAVSAADKKPVVAANKKEAAAKMIAAGEVTGKVINVEGDKKVLTLEISLVYQVPNLGAINNIANIKLQMAQAAQNRDINGMRNLQIQLLQNQAQMYSLKKESHNVDIEAGDNVVVRRQEPPVEFDEKGNIKRLSAKELRELKGNNPRLPGYAADFDDIKPEQVIKIKLAKMKETPKYHVKEDKDAPEKKPVATQIVILKDAPAK